MDSFVGPASVGYLPSSFVWKGAELVGYLVRRRWCALVDFLPTKINRRGAELVCKLDLKKSKLYTLPILPFVQIRSLRLRVEPIGKLSLRPGWIRSCWFREMARSSLDSIRDSNTQKKIATGSKLLLDS